MSTALPARPRTVVVHKSHITIVASIYNEQYTNALLENAKEELGDDFDIRDFHDAILATGPVPLNIMEEQVDAYIAGAKSGD